MQGLAKYLRRGWVAWALAISQLHAEVRGVHIHLRVSVRPKLGASDLRHPWTHQWRWEGDQRKTHMSLLIVNESIVEGRTTY
jgi:hypothetical protein